MSKSDMYGLIKLFFVKYKTILASLLPLVAKALAFNNQVDLIDDLLNEQGYNSKGKTMSKESLKEVMIGMVLKMANKAYAWAVEAGKKDLENILNVDSTSFVIPQDALLILVDDILAVLNTNVIALADYNILPINITAAATAKLNYKNAKDTPNQQISLKKTITTAIKKEFKNADKILVSCDKLIAGEYIDSNATMVLEYQNSRKLKDSIGRHTVIKVHLYGDEEHSKILNNGNMSIDSLKRMQNFTSDGECEIVQFPGGNYTLDIKSKGYVDVHVEFDIKRGQHIEMDVVMVPNRITGNVLKNGKPTANINVNIVGTDLSTMTDAFGNYSFEGVPAGAGVVEISTEGGDSASKTYTMEMGKDLKIDFVL